MISRNLQSSENKTFRQNARETLRLTASGDHQATNPAYPARDRTNNCANKNKILQYRMTPTTVHEYG